MVSIRVAVSLTVMHLFVRCLVAVCVCVWFFGMHSVLRTRVLCTLLLLSLHIPAHMLLGLFPKTQGGEAAGHGESGGHDRWYTTPRHQIFHWNPDRNQQKKSFRSPA